MVTLQLVLTPLSASAQKSESAHLILGLAATGLAPLEQPAGLGGTLTVGFGLRRLNFLFNGSTMLAESRRIWQATTRMEVAIRIKPNLFHL
ncbi:MAG: hypothetical protein NZL89_05305, partial [Leptospiraceae bacterium]|nr:hypothetical protein [Leptospiraceae bacterium]